MDLRLKIPIVSLAIASIALSIAIVASTASSKPAPFMGLSTVMGISVLGSSVLGSSVLASSVLASTTILEAYSSAIGIIQPWLSLALILILIYMELTDPSYGNLKGFLKELMRGWVPVSGLMVLLFFIIVAIKVWGILAA